MDPSLGGTRLQDYLDGFRIDTHWQAGHPIIWQTGQRDGPESADPAHSTHCSAFVAAVALNLNLYLLRPRQHVLKLLSNAQVAWLLGDDAGAAPSAQESGWQRLGTAGEPSALAAAVAAASQGSLVIAGYRNMDADRPGHLVTVLPASGENVDQDGPQVLSVGRANHASIAMGHAFQDHPQAWPDAIHLFARPTELEVGAIRAGGSSVPMP